EFQRRCRSGARGARAARGVRERPGAERLQQPGCSRLGRQPRMNPKRGEVWLVNLDPVIGSELRKTRPAVVVSRDEIGTLPVRVIVPLTGWQERFGSAAWLVPIEQQDGKGITKKSAADTVQIRSVS